MTRLTAVDYERTLDFVEVAAAADGEMAFSRAALARFRELVCCDVAAYREWSPQAFLGGASAADDLEERQRVWEHYPRFVHEDAIPCGSSSPTGLTSADRIGRPLALEDMLTESRFRRTGLYWEICRPFGVRSVLKLYLPNEAGLASGFVFDRSTIVFGEREKLILRRLFPFLVQVRRNARLRTPDARLALLTPREREVLGRAAAGETNEQIATALVIGPSTVRKHLEHVYEKLGVRNRAEAASVYAIRRS